MKKYIISRKSKFDQKVNIDPRKSKVDQGGQRFDQTSIRNALWENTARNRFYGQDSMNKI